MKCLSRVEFCVESKSANTFFFISLCLVATAFMLFLGFPYLQVLDPVEFLSQKDETCPSCVTFCADFKSSNIFSIRPLVWLLCACCCLLNSYIWSFSQLSTVSTLASQTRVY